MSQHTIIRLVSAANARPLLMFNRVRFDEVCRFIRYRFCISGDGKRMAWNEKGKIHVASTETGKLLYRFEGEPGPLALSPDGQYLALGVANGTALLWDSNTM